MNKMTYINERIAFIKRNDSNQIKSTANADEDQQKSGGRKNTNDKEKLQAGNSVIKLLN